MSHLRGVLDDGYRTDCGVKLTDRVRSRMELQYSLIDVMCLFHYNV
jgi:hypothetical protein